MGMSRLFDANENLKTEVWDLREMATNLDLEKQEIILENQYFKEQNRILEAKIDCFRAMVEDFRREEEELQAKLSRLEETIEGFASQNQALQETNQTLRTKIQTFSRDMDFFQDYKVIQELDLSRMKQVMENIVGYFRSLELEIEITEQHREEEKMQVSELTHTLGELEQIQEVQENEMASLRSQLEEASLLRFQMEENTKAPSLLHEMVQAKLIQDSLAMQNTIFLILSKLLWFLLWTIVCMGLVSSSVKIYIFMVGKDLKTKSRFLRILDHSLQWLLEVLFPCRVRRPHGLPPF